MDVNKAMIYHGFEIEFVLVLQTMPARVACLCKSSVISQSTTNIMILVTANTERFHRANNPNNRNNPNDYCPS